MLAESKGVAVIVAVAAAPNNPPVEDTPDADVAVAFVLVTGVVVRLQRDSWFGSK